MHDLADDPDTASTYECLNCGTVVTAETRPTQCDECGETDSIQNRALSLE
jgi:rubrerythrin